MRAKKMRNVWLLLLLAVHVVFTSCTKDSNSVTVNDYCYIKSVTLGTVRRQTGTVNTSFAGSGYIMTINQRDNTIENRDSLPCGSQLSRVLVTITFDGSMLAYREKGSNDGWTAYNSTDSLDLTKPLEFYLMSNDRESGRTYSFKVNVHKQEGDSLYWKQCDSEVAELANMTDMKAFVLNDKLAVLGRKEAGIVLALRTEASAPVWEEAATDLPIEADVQTLRQLKGTLYLSTTDGRILSSTDAKAWTQVGATHSAALTLVEKTDKYFYALSEGKLLRSTDATTWEEDKLDSQPSLLPQTGIRALTVEQANGNSRIVMVGQNSEQASAVVWNKMWNESEKEEDTEWIYFPLTSDNAIPCPKLQHLNLLPYDGKCIAFGGASEDERHKVLDHMYVSHDYGITWRPSTTILMPEELKGTEGCITSTVDRDHFIWIITNAQVWRGRLNRLGFAQQ